MKIIKPKNVKLNDAFSAFLAARESVSKFFLRAARFQIGKNGILAIRFHFLVKGVSAG